MARPPWPAGLAGRCGRWACSAWPVPPGWISCCAGPAGPTWSSSRHVLHLVLALVSAVTVGAVLASRRPRHPVGWLLLGLGLSLRPPA